ncbi:hypothetical protein QE435_004920 [Rhizobium sp. SORGH_AS 787]|nr:hypothetical protein [Rhizobium sp. SORGH_AS_0787]
MSWDTAAGRGEIVYGIPGSSYSARKPFRLKPSTFHEPALSLR